jgi:hypothetical protein
MGTRQRTLPSDNKAPSLGKLTIWQTNHLTNTDDSEEAIYEYFYDIRIKTNGYWTVLYKRQVPITSQLHLFESDLHRTDSFNRKKLLKRAQRMP